MKKNFIAVLFPFLFIVPGFAQKADSVLQVLTTRFPSEKLFIHYDKNAYLAGETMWFKAYLWNNSRPSDQGTNLYMKVTNEQGTILSQKTFALLGATASGSFDFPDSLPQGTYAVFATTASMLTYGADFSYQHTFNIYHPGQQPVIKPATAAGTTLLQFFPESGHLIDGIGTVVGFKATDLTGLPKEVEGTIKTGDGTSIISFKSLHDGMGKLQFRPKLGVKYQAEIMSNGIPAFFPLPEVVPTGINLRIEDEKGGKLFTLARGTKEKERFREIQLIATINNQVVFDTPIDFENYPTVKGHLNTDSLPSGILHFTIFSKEGLPIAERLCWVNNGEYLAKATLREKVVSFNEKAGDTLELFFPETIQRSLSVSITDAAFDGNPSAQNILSSFLLTSDLKGYVHQPAYYLANREDSTMRAADNLLLTHGWTRYEWTRLFNNEFPRTPLNEKRLLTISGVAKEESGKVLQGGKLNIYMESEDSSSQNFELLIDQQGQFRKDSLLFFGKTNFYYVYTNAKGKTQPVVIQIDSTTQVNGGLSLVTVRALVRDGSTISVEPDSELSERYSWLTTGKPRVKILSPVTVEANADKKPLDVVNEQYTTGVFRALGKVNIDNITKPWNDRSLNVMDYIKNRIQQVELVGGRFVSRKNFSLGSGEKWPVGIFIDENPADAPMLRTLRVDQVALVKYYEAGFVGAGSSSPGGALAIYLKKEEGSKRDEKLEFFTSTGYAVAKKYFQPDYTVPENRSVPDLRTTLYWNPGLYTDSETSTLLLPFFNNDVAKKFKVVVQGFDINGKLVFLEKYISSPGR